MSPKVEKQLLKLKSLDEKMFALLEQGRVQKELAMNAKEEEIRIFNEATILEKQIGEEKDIFFELLRKEK